MSKTKWGICNCGKWGMAPQGYDERKHFLVCSCGKDMFLEFHDPREAAYPARDQIQPTYREAD